MNTATSPYQLSALTRLELVAVLGCLSVFSFLFAMVPCALSRSQTRAQRINCVSNLKQIGLSMRLWANEHGGSFPWHVSISETGTMEFAESAGVYRHYLALSDELSTPKVFRCSADVEIDSESDWSQFRNRNLSYFVALDASETSPQTILSGDRNLRGGSPVINHVVRFANSSPAAWGSDIHKRAGNLAIGDGSSQQINDASLRSVLLAGAKTGSLRFSLPKPN